MDSLGKAFEDAIQFLGLHRYRNGRSELDFFSRQMRPRHTLVEIDGKFYNRDTLRKKIKNSGLNFAPDLVPKLSQYQRNKIMNARPYKFK